MVRELAREALANRLHRMIITGELAPGTLLSEAELCELLTCSRTPLREALRQLSYEYLVVLPPRKNVLIPQLCILEFQQAYEAARYLERALVALAIERIDAQQLGHLKDLPAQQEQAFAIESFYDLARLDCEFHVAIAAATQNRHLLDCSARIHGFSMRYTFQAYKSGSNAGLSIAEHARLVEALEQRNVELALERLDEHTVAGRQRIVETLAG